MQVYGRRSLPLLSRYLTEGGDPKALDTIIIGAYMYLPELKNIYICDSNVGIMILFSKYVLINNKLLNTCIPFYH